MEQKHKKYENLMARREIQTPAPTAVAQAQRENAQKAVAP